MTAATSSRLMAELPKNSKEAYRVTRDLWEGRELVNVRVWFRKEAGEWKPGWQGVAVRADLVADLARAIEEAPRG